MKQSVTKAYATFGGAGEYLPQSGQTGMGPRGLTLGAGAILVLGAVPDGSGSGQGSGPG